MKIRTVARISVLNLFVHDAYDTAQFDESLIAEALTRYLRDETNFWNEVHVEPPRNLSRFTLGEIRKRMYSVAEVREAFPDEVVAALERLDDGVWTLTEEGEFKRG